MFYIIQSQTWLNILKLMAMLLMLLSCAIAIPIRAVVLVSSRCVLKTKIKHKQISKLCWTSITTPTKDTLSMIRELMWNQQMIMWSHNQDNKRSNSQTSTKSSIDLTSKVQTKWVIALILLLSMLWSTNKMFKIKCSKIMWLNQMV